MTPNPFIERTAPRQLPWLTTPAHVERRATPLGRHVEVHGDDESNPMLARFVVRELKPDEVFDVPDLPIRGVDSR